jgi:hypothetical protein
MQKSTRTLLAFDETQEEVIKQIKRLLSEDGGSEMSNREFFLLALGLGYQSDVKVLPIKRSNNGVRLEYLKEEDIMMMAAIRLAETGSSDSLLQIEEILDSAEQYAAGGVKLFAEAVNINQDLRIWLQARVKTIYEGLNHESKA